MSKLHAARTIQRNQETPFALPEQVEVPLHQLAGAVKEGLLAFFVGVGLKVMALMMEEELSEVVGPKGKHDQDRNATRHGSESGSVVLGGRKTSVTRPRARYLDGSGEVELSTYAHFAKDDLLGQMALERMVAGLSTRNYGAGLEPVGEIEATGTKRSSVSRRFVERTQSALKELMAKDLSEFNFVALLLDGLEIAGHTMIVTLGIDAKGHKHPLGLREGTTENKGVCRALLRNLIERGLDFDDGILVVIDGGTGLRSAVNSVFGRLALVQRCQIHKRRKLDRSPPRSHALVRHQEDGARLQDARLRRRHALAQRPRQDPRRAASRRSGVAERGTRRDAHGRSPRVVTVAAAHPAFDQHESPRLMHSPGSLQIAGLPRLFHGHFRLGGIRFGRSSGIPGSCSDSNRRIATGSRYELRSRTRITGH